MPSSSIACLEHVNINSDSPIEACTFYLDGMGFVQDPRQGALVDGKVYINNVMWLTAGINQLHIPITSRGCSGAERNVLRGIIGLAYEDIEGLCSRLESIETALAGTQFRWSMRDESTVDICGPDGNRFLAHQQPAVARDTRGFHPGPPSLCLGFQYVELDCPTGAAPAIAAYYKHYFEAAVEVRQQGLPAQTAVILTGGTEHCTELRYAERADYACTPEAPYSLASYGIHLCVYMPDELLPLTMQRLADDGLLWDNPRFGSLDRSLGSSQFRCKDIVDVKARKRHEGPLPLVMEMEHEVRLASHDTSPFLAQESYTVAGREPVPRLVVSEVSSFEKDWPAVRAEKNAATVGYMPSAMLVHDVDIDDVEYLRHDDKPFLATIFKPLGQGPFPVALEVHGGCWCRGSREKSRPTNVALAQRGVIVVAIDFRTCAYPASLADIHYAVRWAKGEAPSWNGVPECIGLLGTSSGAHQAMLLGLRPGDPRYAVLPPPPGPQGAVVDGTVSYVIMLSPVMDPLGRYQYAKGRRTDVKPPADFNAELILSLHDQYWGSEEAMAEGAPARILRRGEKTALPPTLVIHHQYESPHPRPDVDSFVEEFRKAGGQVAVHVLPGTFPGPSRSSYWMNDDVRAPAANKVLRDMAGFAQQHCQQCRLREGS